MNTLRKKILRWGFEPISSVPQAYKLTTVPCHFPLEVNIPVLKPVQTGFSRLSLPTQHRQVQKNHRPSPSKLRSSMKTTIHLFSLNMNIRLLLSTIFPTIRIRRQSSKCQLSILIRYFVYGNS